MGTASTTAADLAAQLEKDGYLVVKSFLDKELVDQARRDLEAIYAKDLEERRLRNDDDPVFTHGSTKSYLTNVSHLVMRLPGKSKALDQCYDRILSHPTTRELVRAIAGDHIKIRDVNCRHMTGADDPGDFLNGPHEWHRDSDGEFCIAIPLNEVPAGDNGATAIVPKSHRYPWDPRWEGMFGAPLYIARKPLQKGPAALTRLNPFNRMLFKRHMRDHTGISVEPGDFYIFLNDTWHGRVPNRHGARPMIAMAGAFPTDFAFPDEPDAFTPEMLDRLPPTYRQAAARSAPLNASKDSIMHRMMATRRGDRPTDLFWWARMERRAAVGLSKSGMKLMQRMPFMEKIVRRAVAR